jgi:hypothetical protein
MKKAWKWIIGIVLGLIVIAILVGVGFMFRGGFNVNRVALQDSRRFSEGGPEMMPNGGYGFHMRGPGMMGYGLEYGIMPFGGIIGGLFGLGFLALVVLGIIWLVRTLSKPKVVDAPAVIPAVIPAEMPAPMPVATVNPCKKCGRPLQDEWKVCPYCGKKV